MTTTNHGSPVPPAPTPSAEWPICDSCGSEETMPAAWHNGECVAWMCVPCGKRLPVSPASAPAATAAPTNCQQEPAYPGAETVVLSVRDPEMTAHLPSSRCSVQAPHRVTECGEFRVETKPVLAQLHRHLTAYRAAVVGAERNADADVDAAEWDAVNALEIFVTALVDPENQPHQWTPAATAEPRPAKPHASWTPDARFDGNPSRPYHRCDLCGATDTSLMVTPDGKKTCFLRCGRGAPSGEEPETPPTFVALLDAWRAAVSTNARIDGIESVGSWHDYERADEGAASAALLAFLHDIETRCDPAGEVQRMASLEEQVRGLTAKLDREAAVHAVMQDDVAALLRAIGLSDHSRPTSPHLVVQEEILPALTAQATELAALRSENERLRRLEAVATVESSIHGTVMETGLLAVGQALLDKDAELAALRARVEELEQQGEGWTKKGQPQEPQTSPNPLREE